MSSASRPQPESFGAHAEPTALTRRTLREIVIMTLILGAGPLAAQVPDATDPIIGSWGGELEPQPGVTLPLVFHIANSEAGYSATMDSPAQGATGIPVQSVTFADHRLILELPPLSASFEGTLTSNDSIEGVWTQGGSSLPLTLGRTESTTLIRPQHPDPPFPYEEEEVTFTSSEGIRLAGTLTLPPGSGPFPAVVLITGSGPQDRDETIVGHKPFLVIADHLTRHGIAVLRYDDRGVSESEGDFASVTTLDFAADAAAAADFLRVHPSIDPERIGLVGHSEGGTIASMVATGIAGPTEPAPTSDIAFVVLLAGPSLPGSEILRLQGAAISRASGLTEEMIRAYGEFQESLFIAATEEDDPEQLKARFAEALAQLAPEIRTALGISPDQEEILIQGQVESLSSPWFRYFLTHDPRHSLEAIQIPVLALFGEKDLQVPAEENRREMEDALETAGNPDATVMVLPDLNHLFQTAETGAPTEYGQIEETFAPEALEVITQWIVERFGNR